MEADKIARVSVTLSGEPFPITTSQTVVESFEAPSKVPRVLEVLVVCVDGSEHTGSMELRGEGSLNLAPGGTWKVPLKEAPGERLLTRVTEPAKRPRKRAGKRTAHPVEEPSVVIFARWDHMDGPAVVVAGGGGKVLPPALDDLEAALNKSGAAALDVSLLRCLIPLTPPLGAEAPAAPSARIHYHYILPGAQRARAESRRDTRCPLCFVPLGTVEAIVFHAAVTHNHFCFRLERPLTGDPHVHITANLPVVDEVDSLIRPAEFTQDFFSVQRRGKRSGGRADHRKRYHSNTGMAIAPGVREDSEDEIDTEWILQRNLKLIDEFNDVASAEKALIRLWNRHLFAAGAIAQRHIPPMVDSFIDKHGPQILAQGLRHVLVGHLFTLWDINILSPDRMDQCLKRLDALAPSKKRALDGDGDGDAADDAKRRK